MHHLNYRNLYDVTTADLRVLCRRCHYLAHDLQRIGELVFSSTDHNHRWALLKNAVKTHLGLGTVNLFRAEDEMDERWKTLIL